MNFDTLNILAQEVWRGRLPGEVRSIEVVRDEHGNLWALARPSRWTGRYGFAPVDMSIIGEPHQAPLLADEPMTLVTAVDRAVDTAVAVSWFDSSYA